MRRDGVIWVVGSLNMDLVQCVARVPEPGETISGADLRMYPGGKGANQACAAARLGGRVRMIGNVGEDASGGVLRQSLEDAGVDVQGVAPVSTTATGSAVIVVLPDGDNAIIVSPGANATLTPEDARARLAGIQRGDLLLCQLETPLDTVAAALDVANAAGATTILDPAPAVALSPELLRRVRILTPNETEATMLSGADGGAWDAPAVARTLRGAGPATVILKMGAAGCWVDDGEDSWQQPAHRVEAVDTTAAGDTFNGALAVELASGIALREAVRFACIAAALSVTREGAQASIPSRDEVVSLARSVGI